MGNRLTTTTNNKTKRKSKKTGKNPTNNDNFALKYWSNIHQNHHVMDHHMDDLLKRHVFVSLLGLYHSWRQCPPFILHSALLIMPLKRDWIYRPLETLDPEDQAQLRHFTEMTSLSDARSTAQFIELLQYKDSQGLVCWMLNDEDYDRQPDECPLVLPIWYHLSKKLMSLRDAVSGEHYSGIHTDAKWWQNKAKYQPKYGVKASSVMSELYFCQMKFKSIQEIVYQSNPNLLIPVISYQKPATNVSSKTDWNIFEAFDDDADDQRNWWISDDYDPYDLATDVLSL